MMDYPNELIGGELVPPLVIRGKYVIDDEHKGTVYVEAGQLNVEGQLNGTLHVKENSEVEISGSQIGTVYIGAGATVIVTGELNGTANLEQGSLLVVEESGRIEGTVFNDGCVVLRGVLGGILNGDGEVKVEGRGQIKRPVLGDRLIYFK